MNLRDLRLLAIMTGLLAAAALVFLLVLAFHDTGRIDNGAAAAALDLVSLQSWLWLGAIALFLTLVALVAMLYLLHEAPPGFARGILRQVQCQRCKAVFDIHDTGHRPITHLCPNCKALGVYDGTAPPVGLPPRPEPAKRVIALGLSCETCDFRFDVTDTGARPLRVRCPHCRAKGLVM